jgi:cation transport regulator
MLLAKISDLLINKITIRNRIKTIMPYESLENLPTEVKEKLPQGAQQIFMAAFNSASSDGMSEDAAVKVAWNSVKNSYEEGENGQWQHKPDARSGNTHDLEGYAIAATKNQVFEAILIMMLRSLQAISRAFFMINLPSRITQQVL